MSAKSLGRVRLFDMPWSVALQAHRPCGHKESNMTEQLSLTHTDTHTKTHTQTHTETQIHRQHTHTQTQRHTNRHTYKDTHTDTHRDTETQATHRHTHRHRHRHTHTHTHTIALLGHGAWKGRFISQPLNGAALSDICLQARVLPHPYPGHVCPRHVTRPVTWSHFEVNM